MPTMGSICADEVGRGSLAGSVVVGAVWVPDGTSPILGVTDSKKLSALQRQRALRAILDSPIQISCAFRTAKEVDLLGIGGALVECFDEVIFDLEARHSALDIRLDGTHLPLKKHSRNVTYIIHGDALDWRIGAASIVAKVLHDADIEMLAEQFPGYGWERNMGYGTKEHQQAIRELGVTEHHRKTFLTRIL